MSAMLFDASLVPAFWQWLWLLVAAAAALVAVVTTPWRLLRAVPMRQHLVFGSAVFLSAIWFLTAISLAAPVTIHLLALATLVLMLGPGLAYLSGLVALLVLVFLQGLEWRVLGVNAVCGVLTPVLSTYAVLVLSRRIKVAQQFVFILGAGFVGAAISVLSVALVSVALLALFGQGGWVSAALDNAALLPLIMFPEGFINGVLVTALVVFHPEWVRLFSEEE